MRVRKELEGEGSKIEIGGKGVLVGDMSVGEEKWRVIGVYVGGGIERSLQEVERWVEDKGEGRRILVGGDFNARTGGEGGGVGRGWEETLEGGRKRLSKDKKVNKEGKRLLEFLDNKGWGIFNGIVRGDEKGEFTFTRGKGDTVIDYVMGDEEVEEKVKRMRIGDRIDSDHHLVELWMEGESGKNTGRRGRGRYEEEERRWRGLRDEEGKEVFRRRMEDIEMGQGGVEEEWERVEGVVREALREGEKERGEGEEKNGMVGRGM